MNLNIFKGLFLLLITSFGLSIYCIARGEDRILLSGATANLVERNIEPIVITGSIVTALENTPVNQLFVYVSINGAWQQIPAQVDEVTASGTYASTEDGVLDGNDEIVFMAKDLGDQSTANLPISSVLPAGAEVYEIKVTDPVSPTHTGWAYLVESATLAPMFSTDYVNFDPATHRIIAESYKLGFASGKSWADYLTLGQSNIDLLDRNKTRVFCALPNTCPLTEEAASALPDSVIKDGPIRTIVRNGRIIGYGSMLTWSIALTVPVLLAGDIQFSLDFTPAISGSIFYNAATPAGVIIDGITDTVPTSPVSAWWQISTPDAALVQVADTSALGGTQLTYYRDNNTLDASDTGDKLHYGDTGFFVNKPNRAINFLFNIYVLPGSQLNKGATYATFFKQPLAVEATKLQIGTAQKIYLPFIIH